MCHYMFLSGIEGPRWIAFGLVVKLTHSVSACSVCVYVSVADRLLGRPS